MWIREKQNTKNKIPIIRLLKILFFAILRIRFFYKKVLECLVKTERWKKNFRKER